MGAGRRAHAAAQLSRERTGTEQVSALAGICAFLAGFFATGLMAPAALTSFWLWVALLLCAIWVGSAVHGLVSRR